LTDVVFKGLFWPPLQQLLSAPALNWRPTSSPSWNPPLVLADQFAIFSPLVPSVPIPWNLTRVPPYPARSTSLVSFQVFCAGLRGAGAAEAGYHHKSNITLSQHFLFPRLFSSPSPHPLLVVLSTFFFPPFDTTGALDVLTPIPLSTLLFDPSRDQLRCTPRSVTLFFFFPLLTSCFRQVLRLRRDPLLRPPPISFPRRRVYLPLPRIRCLRLFLPCLTLSTAKELRRIASTMSRLAFPYPFPP